MIVRLDKEALAQSQSNQESALESDGAKAKVSEADKIISETKQKIAEGSTPAVGVSASNSGRGHDPIPIDDGGFVPTTLEGTVEEEPAPVDEGDSPETVPEADKVAAVVSQTKSLESP